VLAHAGATVARPRPRHADHLRAARGAGHPRSARARCRSRRCRRTTRAGRGVHGADQGRCRVFRAEPVEPAEDLRHDCPGDHAVPARPGRGAGRVRAAGRAEWTKFPDGPGWVIGSSSAPWFMSWSGCSPRARAPVLAKRPGAPVQHGLACLPPSPGPGARRYGQLLLRPPAAPGNGSLTVRGPRWPACTPPGPPGRQAGQGPLAGMVKGTVPWAKAGIIIKASTRPGRRTRPWCHRAHVGCGCSMVPRNIAGPAAA